MPFLKAMQKLPLPACHDEYVEALVLYTQQSKRNSRTLRELEGRNDPTARLLRADEKERYSKECKIFYAIRRKYANQKARLMLDANKVEAKEFEDVDIAKLAGFEVSASGKMLIADIKRKAIRDAMPDEEFERLKKETIELMQKQGKLPGAETKEVSREADTDTVSSIEFDPEFDKL